LEDATFSTYALRHQDALYARRPHHSRGMELHELHVEHRRARLIRQRLSVSRVFPAIAGHAKGTSDAPRSQHNGLRVKDHEASSFALIGECAHAAIAIHQQLDNGRLSMNLYPLMDAMILQRADHFQSSAITHVCQARIAMAAEVPLADLTLFCAIEDGTPRFEL